MKALFLYSSATGLESNAKRIPFIVGRLEEIYGSIDVHQTTSIDDLKDQVKRACEEYDDLIFAGGDGTFNIVINVMMAHEKRPTIGYINLGTMGDIGHNFGITHSIRRALKIIEKKKKRDMDVIKANDFYFGYVLASGTFTSISYATERKKKKVFGKLSYYFRALREVFVPKKYKYRVEANGQVYEGVTPFTLVLNGRYVGGFFVNYEGQPDDGQFEIYLTKPGLFNGLLHYIFAKVRTVKIRTDHAIIESIPDGPWCVDGEKGPSGKMELTLVPKAITIYTK